jgi:uncharacterized protein YifN (PemK superfamily)
MLITYRLNSDTSIILGSETRSGIDEVDFPDINYFHNHPITITKKFSSRNGYRWIVRSVQHPSKTEVIIDVEERSSVISEVYLTQTYKNNSSVISNLQKGVLVEVEYGYFSSIKKSCGDIKSIKRYPDFKQQGEMHKRRLAIVVNATNKFVQVVPITSQVPPNTGDKSIFEINPDSLKDLIDYNQIGKRSFALGSMIQTVSLARILPPLSKAKSRTTIVPERSVGYPYRLIGSDKKLLDSALSIAVKLNDYGEIKKKLSEEYLKNKELTDEIESLNNRITEQENAIKLLSDDARRHEAIIIMIEDHYRELHPHKTHEELRAFVENQIQENMGILQPSL